MSSAVKRMMAVLYWVVLRSVVDYAMYAPEWSRVVSYRELSMRLADGTGKKALGGGKFNQSSRAFKFASSKSCPLGQHSSLHFRNVSPAAISARWLVRSGRVLQNHHRYSR